MHNQHDIQQQQQEEVRGEININFHQLNYVAHAKNCPIKRFHWLLTNTSPYLPTIYSIYCCYCFYCILRLIDCHQVFYALMNTQDPYKWTDRLLHVLLCNMRLFFFLVFFFFHVAVIYSPTCLYIYYLKAKNKSQWWKKKKKKYGEGVLIVFWYL